MAKPPGRFLRRSAGASATSGGSSGRAARATGDAKGGRPESRAAKTAKTAKGAKPAKTKRIAQIRATYAMARRVDPKIGVFVGGAGLAVFVVVLLIGFLFRHPVYFGFLGLLTALAVMAIVFGRRAERAAYLQVEGQPGAAASVLQSLRRGWTVTPAVAVTRNQDLVHRAVGRPGIVLVGEGAPSRVANLLGQEKRKLGRILPDVPVYDFQAGTEEGQIPLRKLQRELMKLPRNLRPAQVSEVDRRLKAMGTLNLPIPKGPLPKNVRMPRPPRM
jgi:hypothetical protein